MEKNDRRANIAVGAIFEKNKRSITLSRRGGGARENRLGLSTPGERERARVMSVTHMPEALCQREPRSRGIKMTR